MADLLGCSIDYIVGRSADPNPGAAAPAVGPKWSTGTPTQPGTYETRVGVGSEDTEKTTVWQRLDWNGSGWVFSNGVPLDKAMNVFRWVKLPEV